MRRATRLVVVGLFLTFVLPVMSARAQSTVFYAYTANQGDNTVSVIDLTANTVVASIPVGTAPQGTAVSPSRGRVYTANQGSGNASVIDTATNMVIATVVTGDQPQQVAVSPDNTRVYVTNLGTDTVSVIDTATNAVVATVAVGNAPSGVGVTPDGQRVYVSNSSSNTVSVVDAASNTVVATVPVGAVPRRLTVSPDGTRIYVTNQGDDTLSAIDTATNTVVATFAAGTNPRGVAVTPDGTRLYVTGNIPGTVTVVDTATNTVVATLTGFNGPAGVATSRDGGTVYVTNAGAGTVSVIAVATNTVTATVPVGSGPVEIAVLANDRPVAAADAYTAAEDTPLETAAPGVLGNDTDADPLTAVLAAPPTPGSLTLSPDGSFTYTPQANHSGAVTFTYQARDVNGVLSEPATATITVGAVNDPPVAVDDDAATPAGEPVTVNVTANDTDVDGDTLSAGSPTAPSGGTATCSAASCTYTPRSGFLGADSFTYTVSDPGGATATATFTVTVAPPDVPVAADDTLTTAEDTPGTVAVIANDILGTEPSTVAAGTRPAHGGLTCSGTECTYTPEAGYHGADSFTYSLRDADGEQATATVTVTVTPVNDPPSLSISPQAIGPGALPPPLSATDPDGDRLTFGVVNGTLPPGVSLGTDGTFTGAARSAGLTVARVRACDPAGACAESDLRIDVRALVDTDTLPRTGAPVTLLVAVGAALLLAGASLRTCRPARR